MPREVQSGLPFYKGTRSSACALVKYKKLHAVMGISPIGKGKLFEWLTCQLSHLQDYLNNYSGTQSRIGSSNLSIPTPFVKSLTIPILQLAHFG